MHITAGGIIAGSWLITFLYLITRSENRFVYKERGAAVIFALPIGVIASLISAIPLAVAEHVIAFSEGEFAVFAFQYTCMLYWREAWIRKNIRKIFASF